MVWRVLVLVVEPMLLQGIDDPGNVGLAQRGTLDSVGPAAPPILWLRI